MRVLVCGSRTWGDRRFVHLILDRLNRERGPFTYLIHGAAAGVDADAEEWGIKHKIETVGYRPEWGKFKLAAGPIRNRQMLLEGDPTLVIAFKGGKGTKNCVDQARSMGIEVFDVEAHITPASRPRSLPLEGPAGRPP